MEKVVAGFGTKYSELAVLRPQDLNIVSVYAFTNIKVVQFFDILVFDCELKKVTVHFMSRSATELTYTQKQ